MGEWVRFECSVFIYLDVLFFLFYEILKRWMGRLGLMMGWMAAGKGKGG